MYKVIICVLTVFSALSCNEQNKKIDLASTGKEKAVAGHESAATATQETKNASALFTYDGKILSEISNFETKVFLYDGNLVLQLLKDKQEINFSLGGTNLYSQKPFAGIFTTAPKENETTALLNLYLEESTTENGNEKIKVPILFDGTATLEAFNKQEIQIEINARGGFYSEMNNPENWKPFYAKIVAKNPEIENQTNITNLYY
ncbi:hypothetical protein QRD02_06530 [Aequorivita sp. SDUM287046]|uniref:Uncharacterized protein n=1 Tax=Aequorivita aurantiaca TaxID=3053356 RepID=A0ABT8DGR0_9FLAO|nr:hypothetical protein [Aequorivita aurantiaca]MDN3724032.1 hypothetical protein [Aequorivita aurantiaca]